MKKFVIITDSCSDLEKELRQKYDIDYIPMRMIHNGNDYPADLDWKDIPVKRFYDLMREGNRITTAQITVHVYREVFEKYIKEGYDVLSISCSSALSASVLASMTARDELLKIYTESKIICIDSLNACYGLGILCITASELRAEGKTIEETAQWLEENKLKMNQECTPEKLSYLKQAGRVSAASAFFGGLLNIKPIIISDAKGQNFAIEKVKGRAASIERLVQRFSEEFEEDFPYQKIFVGHGDSLLSAEELKTAVSKVVFEKTGKLSEIHTGYIGPIVGASCGPGTIVVYFFGKEVTVNKEC